MGDVDAVNVHHDLAPGLSDDPGWFSSCQRALRKGAVLVVCKLDRSGRNLAHLVNTVQDLYACGRVCGRSPPTGRRSTPRQRRAASYSPSSRRWRTGVVLRRRWA